MADTWGDDSDDDWDNDDDDDDLDARLNKMNVAAGEKSDSVPKFDDEEDLAKIEKAREDQIQQVELKKKGSALVARKQADMDRKEAEELARKAVEMEAEMEAQMDPEELKKLKRQQIEEADNALTDDLFGMVDNISKPVPAQAAGDKVVMKDLVDHLKHARKVAACLKVSIGVCKVWKCSDLP